MRTNRRTSKHQPAVLLSRLSSLLPKRICLREQTTREKDTRDLFSLRMKQPKVFHSCSGDNWTRWFILYWILIVVIVPTDERYESHLRHARVLLSGIDRDVIPDENQISLLTRMSHHQWLVVDDDETVTAFQHKATSCSRLGETKERKEKKKKSEKANKCACERGWCLLVVFRFHCEQ